MPEVIILPVNDDTSNTSKSKENDATPIDQTKLDVVDTNKSLDQSKPIDTNKPIDQNNDQNADVLNNIEIDGVEYKLDDKGNAVNLDGSIRMDKATIDKFANSTNDSDFLSEVKKINNIVLANEKGEEIQYEFTPQGIAKRELDIATHYQQVGAEKGINEFFQNNPDLAAMHSYKQRHGTLEGFGKNVDYSTIDIAKADKETLKAFIVDEQISRGTTLDVAKSFAEYAEKNNQLDALGTSAFNNLKTMQVTKYQEQQTKVEEQLRRYYGVKLDNNGNVVDLKVPGSLYDMIITKGEFNGLKIPKDGIVVKNQDGTTVKLNANELFEFAAYADPKTGESNLDKTIKQYMAKAENRLTLGLYILKGGDLSELASAAVNKTLVTKLKINTANNKPTTKSINSGQNNNSGSGIVLPVM